MYVACHSGGKPYSCGVKKILQSNIIYTSKHYTPTMYLAQVIYKLIISLTFGKKYAQKGIVYIKDLVNQDS